MALTLLQPPQSALLSLFRTEVSLYLSYTHQFNYKLLPDNPIAFSVVFDINPENNFLEDLHQGLQQVLPSLGHPPLWGQLLLHQNTLTQHIRQTHQPPYLPNTLHSHILHPNMLILWRNLTHSKFRPSSLTVEQSFSYFSCHFIFLPSPFYY